MTVDLTVTTTINGKLYRFGFWITQVDCSGVERSPIEAPKGCTQYYLGANGVVKSFNFEGVHYLTNHNYRDVDRATTLKTVLLRVKIRRVPPLVFVQKNFPIFFM